MDIPKTCGGCGYFKKPHGCSNTDMEEDVDILPDDEPPYQCPYLDECLDSLRFRVKYRNENFYLVISIRDDMPYEVFVEHPTNRLEELVWMMAGWDTVTRFVSRSLKKEPLTWVVRQLEKSTRKPGKDLPGIIGVHLSKWLPENKEKAV